MVRNTAKPSGAPPSFSDFAVAYLSRKHWEGTSPVPAAVLRDAADAYLFRFDKELNGSFVRHRLQTASAALGAVTGVRPGAALRWLRRALSGAARAYFGPRWGLVGAVVGANAAALARLRRRFVRLTELLSPEPAVVALAPQAVQPLVSAGRPVVLNVFAQYCSKCALVGPAFAEAAASAAPAALFAAVDAGRHPEARQLFDVDVYPTILRLRAGSAPVYFPRSAEHSAQNLAAFARGEHVPAHGPGRAALAAAPRRARERAEGERGGGGRGGGGRGGGGGGAQYAQLGQWAAMLQRQGIDELDALVRDRDIVVHMRIDKAIQCGGTSCEVLAPRDSATLPPVCVLFGGGMGAGKTTAVSAVADTGFWHAHGDNVVVVEADAFKREDPFFHALGAVTPAAARVVHADSISAAETLFLTAVNRRRDVVFDGTLSWAEYARQTVAMLRDGEFEYERGAGYTVLPNGTAHEEYWRRKCRREVLVQPYRIELVAVTVDAETAVARGIVRHILEGRGVPIADQLKSHALFSSHFEKYIRMVDSVYLFDMSTARDVGGEMEKSEEDDMSTSAKIIAMRPGVLFSKDGDNVDIENVPAKSQFEVKDQDAYERFLRKALINTKATCASDLYL